jgi:hypothetical protein
METLMSHIHPDQEEPREERLERRTLLRRAGLVAVGLALAPALHACGGGDDEEENGGEEEDD